VLQSNRPMTEEDGLMRCPPAGRRNAWSPAMVDEPASVRPTDVIELMLALREVPDE